MAADEGGNTGKGKRIVVIKNGPYSVEGGVPLVAKTQVVSEYGEPLTWRKDGAIDVSEGGYDLCRCGRSGVLPFCDGAHKEAGFDGTETADTDRTEARSMEFPDGTHMIVKGDPSLCMQSGFCGLRDADMSQLVAATHDTKVRSLVMAMVER
jgi:CDGSH-type Zn-finger protein